MRLQLIATINSRDKLLNFLFTGEVQSSSTKWRITVTLRNGSPDVAKPKREINSYLFEDIIKTLLTSINDPVLGYNRIIF